MINYMAKKQISENSHIIGLSLDENAKKHKVKTTFIERVPNALSEGEEEAELPEEAEEEGEEQELFTDNEYTVKSRYMPHKDFLNAMGKLTKYALEICEIDDKSTNNYYVSSFRIQGDMTLKQSRIILTLCKFVERTNKVIKFNTPQVSMYGTSDYQKAQHLTKAVEDVLFEAWAYVAGKYGDQPKGQLPLFERALMRAA